MKEYSIDQILDFAIGKEEEAANFYRGLADWMKFPHMKEVFLDFAQEEEQHKVKLQAVKKGKIMLAEEEKILDLKLSDHLVDVKPSADIDYKQALIIAMKEEKAAFALYSNLAAAAADPKVKTLFQTLAHEEARHKLRFELEYDDQFSGEN